MYEVIEDLLADVEEALHLLDTAVDSFEASRLAEMNYKVREVEGLWRWKVVVGLIDKEWPEVAKETSLS